MNAALRGGRQRGRLVAAAYFATGVLAAAMLVGAPRLPLSGSAIGLVLVVALALAPVAGALAIERPLIVPFALWAALVPFDNLLTVAGIGKLAKPLGAAAALAALIAMLLRRRALLPPPAAGIWSLLALYAALSLFWARSPDFGITMLQQIAGLLVVGTVLSMFPADERDLRALFCGVVGGGAAAGIYAIVMYALTGHPLFIGDTSSKPIDHNHFGAALLLPALCATMGTISARRPWRAGLCALGAALCVAGIGVSQSRGALIALGIALAYLVVRSRHRRKLLWAAVAGSALLACIPGTLSRFSDSTVSDGAGRYQIWHIGLAAFKHHWFAGHGFGMFMPAYQASFLEYAQPAQGAQRVQMPHNILIEFSVELGVVGVLFLLLAWWWQLRTLREVGPHEGGWTDAAQALEAATIALFVSALSLDLLTFKYTWLALSAAWILRAAYRSRPRTTAVMLTAALVGAFGASASAAGARPGHPARAAAFRNGTEWPARFRPYAPTSYWNRPMPDVAHPKLLPDSDAIVHRAEDGSPGRMVRVGALGSGWDEGHPVVFASARDPLVKPHCKTYCNPVFLTRPFHIPARARAGDGSDRHLAVVQPDGTEIDLWAVDQPERDWHDGDEIAYGSGNTCGNFFRGPGFGRETSTVGGACLGAGLIRAAELRAGTIPHALFTTVDCGARAFVYPAAQPIDNACSGPGPHVPNGAHLWLDLSDARIAALPLRGWEKTVLRALHHYGAYVEDTGSGGARAHGLFAPWFEDDAQYSAFGRPNPLAAWAREQRWQPVPIRARTAAQRPTTWFTYSENWAPLDWASHLHVVDPCYAQGTC